MVRESNIPPLMKKPCAACLQSLPALPVKADGDANFDILRGDVYTATLLLSNTKTYTFTRKNHCSSTQHTQKYH